LSGAGEIRERDRGTRRPKNSRRREERSWAWKGILGPISG